MAPRVTIITVTYNRAHILPISVDSVLAQDYPNFNLLIVDDGSTDGTADVLRRYAVDPRVEVLRHESNRGVIAARNTALDNLADDVAYFGYNDSDDMLLPGAISKAVAVLERHGDRYSMLYGWAQDATTREPQGSYRRPNGQAIRSGEITLADCLEYRIGGDWFQLVRRDLLGSMRYDPRAGGGEGILWARILRNGPALLVDDALQLKDRSGADRVNRSNVRYDRASAESRMWIYVHELQTLGVDMRRAHPKSFALLLTRLAHTASMAGEARRARMAARVALRVDPSPVTLGVAVASLLPAWLVRSVTRVVMRWVRMGRQLGAPRLSRHR